MPISAFKYTGGEIQLRLVRALEKLDPAQRSKHRPILLAICDKVLEPSMRETALDYKTLTFANTPLPATKNIEVARRETISLLKQLYESSLNDQERQHVLSKMSKATRTPTQGNYSNALFAIILNDTLVITTYLKSLIPAASFEVKKAIEGDAWSCYRMLHDATFQDDDDGTLAGLGDKIVGESLAIRDLLAAESEFNIFKTLVSLNSVVEPAWDEPLFDWRRDEAWRAAQIASYVDSMSPETIDAWWKRIERCANSNSNDGASHFGLVALLNKMCQEKPELVLGRLKDLDEGLVKFLPIILSALWPTPLQPELIPLIKEWIEKGQHLVPIARQFRIVKEARPELFAAIFESACGKRDVAAVLVLVETLISTYKSGDQAQKKLFLDAADWLFAQGNYDWPQFTWYLRDQFRPLVNELNAAKKKRILSTLIPCREVDVHVEWVLEPFLHGQPEVVLDFFEGRISHAESKTNEVRFEAIPYSLSELDPLQSHPQLVLSRVIGWLQSFPTNGYDVGRLFVSIFPEITDTLKQAMLAIVATGESTTTSALVQLLHNYNATPAAVDICREVIAAASPDEKRLLDEVTMAITSTGTLTGEFGIVEAHKKQRALLEPWLEDQRSNVAAFATRFIGQVDRNMAAEQDRVEQEVAIEKLRWGREIVEHEDSSNNGA